MNILSLFHDLLGWTTLGWLALIIIVFIVALCRFLTKSGRIIKDCDAVVFPVSEDGLKKSQVGQLILEKANNETTDFAEDLINVSSISASYKMNLRLAQSTPSILTSLGILGTFIGLSFAVLLFDSTSSESIRESINSLLSGMGTAFFTSVFGMLFSVLFLYVERKRYNALCNSVDRLCDRTDAAYHKSSDQLVDTRLKDISEQISGVQLTFGDDLEKIFDKKVTPVMDEISKKLENPAQAVVDGLILEFKNLTNGLADILTEKVNGKMTELMDQLILTTDAMKGIPEEIAGSIEAQKNVTAEFAGQIESLKSIEGLYSAAIERITSANSDLADAKSNIATLTSKITAAASSIENASSGMVKSNDKMLKDFENIHELNREVTDQVKTYSERIKGIEGGLKSIFGEIEKGLTSYATTSSKNMQGLLDVFTNSVTDACQQISNATAPLHETIGGILKALDKTEKSAQALLKRVENLPQQKA